jgi:hypothetical protein
MFRTSGCHVVIVVSGLTVPFGDFCPSQLELHGVLVYHILVNLVSSLIIMNHPFKNDGKLKRDETCKYV